MERKNGLGAFLLHSVSADRRRVGMSSKLPTIIMHNRLDYRS